MRQRFAFELRQFARVRKLTQALADPAREVFSRQIVEIQQPTGAHQGGTNLLSLTNVRKEFAHGNNPLRLSSATEMCRDHLEKLIHVGEQEIVRAAEMGVEGGTAHVGFVQHILYRDLAQRFLLHQATQGNGQAIARLTNTRIYFHTAA